MKRRFNKIAISLLSASLVMGFALKPSEVFADSGPYISFGEDLTADQKQAVLELMGIEDFDEDLYTVNYVSNKEEHEYLDDYLPTSKIGSKALSSVLVEDADTGSGITVTTKNINYCTSGMYANALATAGVDDVDVIVAAPFEISGTAALIGAAKAYSDMEGEEVDEDLIDGAIDEMVTTGEIEEDLTEDEASSLEVVIADLKSKIASGEISSDELEDAIRNTASEYDLELTDEQVAKIKSLLDKLSGLNLDVGSIASQAESLADQVGEVLNDAAGNSGGFFGAIADFFKGILSFFGF